MCVGQNLFLIPITIHFRVNLVEGAAVLDPDERLYLMRTLERLTLTLGLTRGVKFGARYR